MEINQDDLDEIHECLFAIKKAMELIKDGLQNTMTRLDAVENYLEENGIDIVNLH